MSQENSNDQISWKRILFFFATATLISNIFRFDLFDLKSGLEVLPVWLYVLTNVLLEGSGVLIAAFISYTLLQKTRKTDISLIGTSLSKSIIMALIPILLLLIIGVRNEFSMNIHLYGLIAICGSLVYCIMEEYGWRAYLHEELKGLKSWHRYVLIGTMWYAWHLSFLTEASITENLFFLSMLIFGSWGIGQVVESTKSVIAASCFHLIIQIMMFNGLIKNGLDNNYKFIILGVSVGIWFLIIKRWERENKSTVDF